MEADSIKEGDLASPRGLNNTNPNTSRAIYGKNIVCEI